METIYLYCVTRKELSLPNTLKGIGEGTLELITWAELAGVGSVLPADSYSFSFQDMCLHKEVVEYIHTFLPVIPMRFSTTLNGRQKVIEFLQRNYSRLEETLTRLEGKAEVGLRIILNNEECEYVSSSMSSERVGSGNGVEYLKQKKRVRDGEHQLSLRAEEVSRVLEQKLRHLIIESQFESNRYMFSICYLVRKDRLEEFERAFGEIKGELPERILYSGPWPPYSFVPGFMEI